MGKMNPMDLKIVAVLDRLMRQLVLAPMTDNAVREALRAAYLAGQRRGRKYPKDHIPKQ